MAIQFIANISLLITDYDEAIAFYVDCLGFSLLENQDMGNGKRWVRVAPPGAQTSLLLVKATNPAQIAQIGHQAGGKVLIFLHTDDFHVDYRRLSDLGVKFLESPREEPYATVAVFQDPFGNKWDLLQPKNIG